ncbi:DNA polymerase eta isoform X3 [Elaeis guineensis]|nr:DNA polymerase eta isoform X2 [Elaeis guineensis]
MRGDEAKKVCPNIQLIQVPVARGKADLNLYRNAGSEVVSILATKGRCERASIDEVYLDLTDAAKSMLLETPLEVLEAIDEEALKSHILGVTNDIADREGNVREWLCRSDADHEDKLLACGAIIIAQLRTKVLEETKFTCSAGIAHNKMLAKLASAMHKPAQQTVVPSSSVKDLLASLPVKKMKQLGGKLGSSLQTDLEVKTVGDLLQFTEEQLQEHYGINTGTWLWNIARGINGEEVEDRLLPKSHGCGKTFPGPQALKTTASVENWLNQLCEELSERIQSDLDQNKRLAHMLTLHAKAFKVNDLGSHKKFPSKSCPLRYGTAKIQEDAMKLFVSGLREFLGSQNVGWGVTSLSVTASKLLDIPHGTSIVRFLQDKNASISLAGSNVSMEEIVPLPPADQNGKQNEGASEKIGDNNDTLVQDKALRRRGTWTRKPKDKAKCSILNFFQGSNSSSWTTKEALDGSFQDHAPLSSSGNQLYSGVNKIEQQGGPAEANNGTGAHPNQTGQKIDTWTFNIEDIDPSVIDELPLEIQSEVQGWLQPPKCANKRGSNIEGSNSSRMFKDHAPLSSSANQHYSGANKIEQKGGPAEANNDTDTHPDQSGQKFDTWTFKIADIDPSIIDELPLEIQREVQGGLQSPKHANTSKRGSSIESSNSSSCMTKEALDGFFKDHAPLSSSGSQNHSGTNKIEQGGPTKANNSTSAHPNQTGQKFDTWTFNIEDIDPSIIDELPLEIQREVQGWLRIHKRANTSKRGSSIVHYFSSAKKS